MLQALLYFVAINKQPESYNDVPDNIIGYFVFI